MIADLLLEQSRGLDAVEHAPAARGIGDLKPREHGLISEKRLAVDEGGRHSSKNRTAAPRSPPSPRDRRCRKRIAAEPLGHAYLSFHEHAIVRRILKIFRPDLVGGEHHGHRHQRWPIDRLPVEEGKKSVPAVHRSVVLSIRTPARRPARRWPRLTASRQPTGWRETNPWRRALSDRPPGSTHEISAAQFRMTKRRPVLEYIIAHNVVIPSLVNSVAPPRRRPRRSAAFGLALISISTLKSWATRRVAGRTLMVS